jgi:peptidoglycan/xylan/chitin deacetylase (PgdA/CDA1 family)
MKTLLAKLLAVSWTQQIFAAENLTVPTAHIAKFAGDRAAAISYTFDDGLRDQFTLAVPLLNEAGFKGTFFVVPGRTAETPEAAAAKQFEPKVMGSISWPELKTMAAQGHEIASHTWSHRNQAKISAAEADTELSKSFDALKSHMGKAPLTLAFPYNQSTPKVRTNALKYFAAYRAFQIGTGSGTTTASLNRWADKLVKEQKWGILMAHSITNGYAAMSDAEVLRGHFKFVQGRTNEIWVDTFANIARYERERDAAKLKFTREADGVSCVLSSALDPQRYDVPLTVVIDALGVTAASAKRAGQELPVRVGHGIILIEATPDTQPITVTFGKQQLH